MHSRHSPPSNPSLQSSLSPSLQCYTAYQTLSLPEYANMGPSALDATFYTNAVQLLNVGCGLPWPAVARGGAPAAFRAAIPSGWC